MLCTREWVKDLLTKVLKKKLNNYSTEEQKIGTWIDGSDIYRKVYQGTFTFVSSTQGIQLITDELNSDNSILINQSGYFIDKSGSSVFIPNVVRANVQQQLMIVNQESGVAAYWGTELYINYGSSCDYSVIVEYIKK